MQFVSLRVQRQSNTSGSRSVRAPIYRKPWAVAMLCASVLLSSGRDVRAGTLVSFDFANFGTVLVDLFDDATPISAANLLQYINANSYDISMVHRVDTGLGVIQGGGFLPSGLPLPDAFGMIDAEVGLPNQRGTLAMARGEALNSAQSQWYFNTADNTTVLGPANNGGFTVFGWVVGGGMSVVDAIAAVPTFGFPSPFNQVPLTDYTQEDFGNQVDAVPHAVVLTSVSIVSQDHPSFQNPFLNTDVDNSNSVTQADADVLLTRFGQNSNQSFEVMGPFGVEDYVDVSGDGFVSPLDLLRVYNALIEQSAAPFVGPLAASPAVMAVPEPSSVALAGAGILALLGCAIARRRRRRR